MKKGLNNSANISSLAKNRFRQKNRSMFSFCITPMIDIIFLLLTFFVLTANFNLPEDFLSLHLPTASAAQNKPSITPLLIDITSTDTGCAVRFNANTPTEKFIINNDTSESDLETFADMLSIQLKDQNRKNSDPISIKCDNSVKWGHLIKIYNVINETGLSNITFNLNKQ